MSAGSVNVTEFLASREAFGIAAEHPETGAFDAMVHAVTAELAGT